MEAERLAKIKASILEAEKRAKVAREATDKAKRAGFDVAEQERRLAETEAKIARAKAVYIEGK